MSGDTTDPRKAIEERVAEAFGMPPDVVPEFVTIEPVDNGFRAELELEPDPWTVEKLILWAQRFDQRARETAGEPSIRARRNAFELRRKARVGLSRLDEEAGA